MRTALSRWVINLWPPLFGSGIRITRLSRDFHEAEIVLRQTWLNANGHGTHFGGSLFAMTDMGYALLRGRVLGSEYAVWDKSGEIDFIAPGRGTVKALFRRSAEKVAEIREATRDGAKYLAVFDVDVVDQAGELVARARRTLYVRRRRQQVGSLDKARIRPISG